MASCNPKMEKGIYIVLFICMELLTYCSELDLIYFVFFSKAILSQNILMKV